LDYTRKSALMQNENDGEASGASIMGADFMLDVRAFSFTINASYGLYFDNPVMAGAWYDIRQGKDMV